MSIAKTWIINLLNPKTYIWIDVLLLKETKRAILIGFDGKKAWFSKAWIARIKRSKTKAGHCESQRGEAISIKISEYHWSKKFQ